MHLCSAEGLQAGPGLHSDIIMVITSSLSSLQAVATSVTKQPFINLTVQWAHQINDEMTIVRLHGELEVITVTKQKSCSLSPSYLN